MSHINVIAIKTSIYQKEVDWKTFLFQSLKDYSLENKVLAITSKLISLNEGAYVSKSIISKKDLIIKEADLFIGETVHGSYLAIKNGLLAPSAGIDESNSENDHYLLLPSNPFESAKSICKDIKDLFNLKNFGVILTDSHSIPLRAGVVGSSISFYGFAAIVSKVGSKDLFNREIKMTCQNVADMLASAAVLVMGETDECTPMALIEYTKLDFSHTTPTDNFFISVEDDLILSPLVKNITDKCK